MTRLIPLTLFSGLSCLTLLADEFTVEAQPFTIQKTIDAATLPDDGVVLLEVAPKQWSDYKIVELADHGSRVSQGTVLVRFDSEAIDKNITDLQRSIQSNTLKLAQAELDLKHLEQTAPDRNEAFKRAADQAAEEFLYFTETRRKASEEAADQRLTSKKQTLENQREELRQLKDMYLADDLTEDTEEIILTRQQHSVKAAEFAVRIETLDHDRLLEVILPREAVQLTNQQRDTARLHAKAQQDIPREIELKQIEAATLKTTLEREKQSLAKVQADRSQFEFKASGDGWFYHGPIRNGRWTPAEAAKSLFVHGRPAANKPFASFVLDASPLGLVAFLDAATARALQPGLKGLASLAGREDIQIPVTLAKLATIPGPDGKYRADLTPVWPDGFAPVIGSGIKIHLIAYHQAAALTVPSKALRFDPQGWTVEVKLADGKTERRIVNHGRVSGDRTEILSGLEIGQVIVLPASS